MQSVTSNAVAVALQNVLNDFGYSTEEVNTGVKYTDGKYIYKKTWIDPNNAWNSSSQQIGVLTNYSTIIKTEASAYSATPAFVTNYYDGSTKCLCSVNYNTGAIMFYRSGLSDNVNLSKKVTVWYTKTTG